MRFTQQTNARFAEIAAALPGNTQQYIEVGKRLSDTAARIVSSDTAKAIQEANALRAARGAEALTGPSRKQQQGAIQELLESMTTQTVLAGMGGGGAGRTMGPYGLPQLTERMIGEDQVTMGQFQRYAAIFRDPAMAQALERYIPEINKTQRNTVERFKVLKRMYDEVLPPEVIRAYERSLEGIKETYYTAFMNPETGLFGIGRKLKDVARNMNQFGQYIKTLEDGTEKVLTEAEIAAGQFEMVDMSVFDLFRDILANVGVVLGPIVNNLTLLFDPMKNVANALTKAREATAKFLYSFEYYRQGLIDFSKNLSKEDKVNFAKIDINFRASLAAINNLYKQLGIISGADFLKNAKQLESIEFDAAAMLKGFIDQFMDSKLASQIGNTVGVVVGTVITQMANMVSMFAGLAKPNKLVQGFMDGFAQAKGPEAIQAIIKGVFQIITKALIEVFKLAPAQFTALGGIVLLLPAFISGVSVAIGTFVETALDLSLGRLASHLKGKAPKEVLDKIDDVIKPGGPLPTRARPGSGGMIFDPYTPEAPAPVKPSRAARLKGFVKGAVGVGGEIESVLGKSLIEFLKKFQNFFAKVGPAITKAITALKGSGVGISAGLSGLVTLLTKLDDFFIGVIDGNINILDDIVSGAKGLGSRGMAALRGAAAGTKGLGAKGLGALRGVGSGAKGLGAAAKGLPVRIMGVAKNVAAGAKGAAGGLGGLLTKGTKMLGKGGGILTVGVGIIEAITSLLSGDSLGTALGKGAGPVLGTIIGTALLGPLGGIIGGMIGSMEEVTGPLGDAAGAIMGTLGTTFEFLGQIGGDLLGMINGLVGLLPGVSEGFNVLEFALFALLSPFKLLEIAISGLYDLYLTVKKLIPGLGLTAEEQERLDKRHTQALTDQFTIMGRLRSGYSLEEQKRAEYAKWLEAQQKGDTNAMNRSAEYMKSIEQMLKEKGGSPKDKAPAGTGPEKPKDKPTDKPPAVGKVGYLTKNGVKGWQGTDGNWTPLVKPTQKGDAAKASLLGDLPKTSNVTAKNTEDLNKKATQQVTATDATKNAVVAQKASLNTIQSTLSSIFALMASGGLRVQTQQQTPNVYVNGVLQKNGGLGDLPFDTTQTDPNKPSSIFQWAKGGLGDAVAKEMKMKPPGSDLVIANSSETVIPAAGGHGMLDFVETLRAGFGAMVATYKEAQQKQENTLNAIKNTLISNQQQTNMRLAKLETKFSTPGMAGGLGGGAAGGVDAFTGMAQRYGLSMTSAYRPGDPGYHGSNRARDYSNGTGPTPQMLQFAQFLASNYGANLKELIYTPLGFSIKNGQKVAPYAQGSHYNHVHVAYAMGAGNPAFFSNKEDAVSWENKFLGKGVKSVTTNTAELAQAGDGMMGPSWLPWNWGKLVDQERKTNKLNRTNRAIEEMVEKGYISPNSLYRQNSSSAGSAPTTINAPITINQQPGEDSEALANRVATMFFDAVKNAQSSSIFT
jgi:hypothetical protein